MEDRIRGVSDEANLNETGRVLSVGYVYTYQLIKINSCLPPSVVCCELVVTLKNFCSIFIG
ncbi:MAG: hypothetical protein M5F18_05565 [Asgard group archaeon]|nr:hypothetical protein [Asgard group archaeon]